ncbi:hypothetical protein MLD38_015340 [Melastoma candidum]|uniref:Uncharacterized protein n=1 Tax=Melastoma candidum TaxID=119954 RepID=A0ACB9RH59_9MYRT|nr:hypothetical protein MLD38_015340 [Melastoma candidum]
MKGGSMAKFMALILTLAFHGMGSAQAGSFWDTMFFTWGPRQSSVFGNGNVQLLLDKTSGSAVQTKNSYLFGSFEMMIKLVPRNSAGTVTAYYLSSKGDRHDEIDYEFLGNVEGRPYVIHTNIFTQGVGNREQQFHLWFDPRADFHNYTIHWNPYEVVWYVDSIPIRVFRNYENQGIPFPNEQAMKAYSSLWDAEQWATEGGLIKTDWTMAPFTAEFRNFQARACQWYGPYSTAYCSDKNPRNWYTSPAYHQLTYAQQGKLKWVRDNYMIYDYCKDTQRFDWKMPPECSKPQY